MDFSGVLGQLLEVKEVAESIKSRYDAVGANPTSAVALLRVNGDISSHLLDLQLHGHHALNRLLPYERVFFIARIDAFVTAASQSTDRVLRKLKRMEQSWKYSVTHAKRNEAILSQLTEQTLPITQSVELITAMLSLAGLAERNTAELKAKLVELQTAIEKLQTPQDAVRTDSFRAAYMAPGNSKLIVMDYTSKGDDGTPATCEGKLRRLLLHDATSSVVGVISGGKSGVGKTSALRAIATDDDIQLRFPGGVYFMTMGADVTVEKLLGQLCGIVEASGGRYRAREMQREKDLKMVIQKVAAWFLETALPEKPPLFILDDVWTTNDVPSNILSQLSVLVSNGNNQPKGSRLLYSTRHDELLALVGDTVTFNPRDPLGPESRNILLRVAGVEEADVEAEGQDAECSEAIDEILKICDGLPFALSLCGTGVKSDRGAMSSNKRAAWKSYLESLRRHELVEEATRDNYPGFGVALLVSLEFLDKSSGQVGNVRSRLSYRELHRRLFVMQKQDWIPVPALCHLWCAADHVEAKKKIKAMESVGVADAEYRNVGGKQCLGLRLHDLAHDFTQSEAEKHGELSKSFRQMLEGYRSELPRSVGDGECWPANVEDDGYALRNMCRIIHGARGSREVFKLLSHPRWVVKMMTMNAVLQFEGDVQSYLKWRESDEGGLKAAHGARPVEVLCSAGNEQVRDAIVLKTLCKIVRMSLSYALGNTSGGWFQLYARLLATRPRCEWVANMMREVEESAPRAWVKAITPCLKGADDPLLQSFDVPYTVYNMRFVEGQVVMSCGADRDGVLFVGKHFESGQNEIIRLRREANTASHGAVDSGHHKFVVESEVVSDGSDEEGAQQSSYAFVGAISVDGKRVVLGFNDGSLRVFGTESGEMISVSICDALAGRWGGVNSIAVTADGIHLVSVRSDGTFRVWDAETGEELGEAVTGGLVWVRAITRNTRGAHVLFRSTNGLRGWDLWKGLQVGEPPRGHHWVATMAMNPRCTRVVSGTLHNGVRMWDLQHWNMRAEEPTPREQDFHSGRVTTVAVSADGTRVVSGRHDRAVIVSDAETGESVKELKAGQMGSVEGVSLNTDGTRVAAAVAGTIRVWDAKGVQRDETYEMVDEADAELVSAIRVSTDGTRVVSGGGSVRVWDAETGMEVRQLATRFTLTIAAVGISSDGSHLASGTFLGGIRVWDMRTWDKVGKDLKMESSEIERVAVSDDGMRVLSKARNGMLRAWDVQTGSCVHAEAVGNGDQRWGELSQEVLRRSELELAEGRRSGRRRFEPWGKDIVRVDDRGEQVVASFEQDVLEVQASSNATTLAVILETAWPFDNLRGRLAIFKVIE